MVLSQYHLGRHLLEDYSRKPEESKRAGPLGTEQEEASHQFRCPLRIAEHGGTLMAAKQCSYGDTRVYFYVVMTRGQINAHTFTDVGNFPGDTQDGAAKCVNQLPQMLTSMLGPTMRKPMMLFTDRGPGFYHRGQGVITGDYVLARRQHGYGLWAGTNANSGPLRGRQRLQTYFCMRPQFHGFVRGLTNQLPC